MRRFLLTLLLPGLVACSRHQVDLCYPACDEGDQEWFAECVAYGSTDDNCPAGHRRCCALAAECLGPLDDQVVETTADSCEIVEAAACSPPCDDDDRSLYATCLSSGSVDCSAGDVDCCVSQAFCIGALSNRYVDADNCCVDQLDCDDGERCEPMTFTCMPITSSTCGNGMMEAGEECDDSNDLTDDCTYGAMSCVVCGAGCVHTAGNTSYCGDSFIDTDEGEECDPPTRSCDTRCQDISTLPLTCSNGSLDGMETDTDCGGPECLRCVPGDVCLAPSDCMVATTECPGFADCASKGTISFCVETVCVDGDDCTDDVCVLGVGCANRPTDFDMDGFGPGPGCLGGGNDCDDFDDTVNPGVTFDICDGVIDHNCDGTVDERC